MKLFHGDCLELMKGIPDGSIDMVLCDLPYGKTLCKWDVVIQFESLWMEYNRICKHNAAILLFGTEPFSSNLRISNISNYRYDWIWNKEKPTNFAQASKQPLKYHEIISVFYKKQPTYNPQMTMGKRNHSVGKGIRRKENLTVLTSKIVKNKTDGLKYPKCILNFNRVPNPMHPTEKPVPLLEYLIKTYTNPSETVLDNCMGSGSTGVACVNTGRDFIGMELDAGYYEIACKRIEEAQKKQVWSLE